MQQVPNCVIPSSYECISQEHVIYEWQLTVSPRMHHSSVNGEGQRSTNEVMIVQQAILLRMQHRTKELTLWQPTFHKTACSTSLSRKVMLLQPTHPPELQGKPEDDFTTGSLTCIWFLTPNLIRTIMALWDWVTAAPQWNTVTIVAAEIIWCAVVAWYHIVRPEGITEEIGKIEHWLIKARWPFSQNGACVLKSAGFLVLDWQKHLKSCMHSITTQTLKHKTKQASVVKW